MVTQILGSLLVKVKEMKFPSNVKDTVQVTLARMGTDVCVRLVCNEGGMSGEMSGGVGRSWAPAPVRKVYSDRHSPLF